MSTVIDETLVFEQSSNFSNSRSFTISFDSRYQAELALWHLKASEHEDFDADFRDPEEISQRYSISSQRDAFFTPVKDENVDSSSYGTMSTSRVTHFSEVKNGPPDDLKTDDAAVETTLKTKQLSVEEFKTKYFARHFIIYLVASICVQANFFLLSYLTNLFTQVYVAAVSSAISMLIGSSLSGWLLERVGLRASFIITSAIASSGGLCLLFFGLAHQDELIFPILFLFTFTAIACQYSLCISCVVKIFEFKRATRV